MAAFVLVALALLAISQPGLSRPEEAAGNNFDAMIKEFQASIEKTVEDVKKNMPKDGQGVVNAIKEQSEKAEKAMNDMKTKMDEALKKNPQISGAIADLQKKIQEARDKIKKEMPDVDANAQKVADAMKSAYESVGKEMERMNAEMNKKGGLKDDLTDMLKNLIDRSKSYAEDFQLSRGETKPASDLARLITQFEAYINKTLEEYMSKNREETELREWIHEEAELSREIEAGMPYEIVEENDEDFNTKRRGEETPLFKSRNPNAVLSSTETKDPTNLFSWIEAKKLDSLRIAKEKQDFDVGQQDSTSVLKKYQTVDKNVMDILLR